MKKSISPRMHGEFFIPETLFFPLFVFLFLFVHPVYAAQQNNDDAIIPVQTMNLASPSRVILSPVGGRLDFVQDLEIEQQGGKSIITFAIPEAAANLQVSVKGRVIERFSMDPVTLNIKTNLFELRQNMLAQKTSLEAELLAVNSRIALLQGIPGKAGVQEIEQLQQEMATSLPELVRQKIGLQGKLDIVNQKLQNIFSNAEVGRRVIIVLDDAKRDTAKAEVNYSYMLPNCGWSALYEFNARPGEGSGDIIDVRLLADVWQYSGIDWKNAEITLATRGYELLQPAPLPEWIIDSSPKQEPRHAPMLLKMDESKIMAREAMTENGDGSATADTQSVFASWTLLAKTLPEGKSRIPILADAWNAPLQWLARPGNDGSGVFLMARYDLPKTKAWPQGMAEYCVNGQSVGSGPFRPTGGEATIYFGTDPRVQAQTSVDSRKRGEKGIINTSRNWSWAWTFTISNEHDKAINVRLERPMPMIVDQDVSVTYENRPEAQKDEKEHYFYWNVNVPAHGKAEVKHAITISSPTKLPLLPDVP